MVVVVLVVGNTPTSVGKTVLPATTTRRLSGLTPRLRVVCACYLRALVPLYGGPVGHGWLVKPHPFFQIWNI